MVDVSKLHVFSNGTDILIGETAQEAIEAYCLEIGEDPSEYPGASTLRQVPDDKQITVNDDGRRTTRTARCWIDESVAQFEIGGYLSRMIASTEV